MQRWRALLIDLAGGTRTGLSLPSNLEFPSTTHATAMPAGTFMARGARGQYVVVVPSARLVIVKLGDADTPPGDIDQMVRVVNAAVE